eukprot:jgi/Orpsp1_1/1187194/evm.model.d7180000056062.1
MEDQSNTVNTTATKREITPDYYPLWSSDMDLMLTSKGLDRYIYEEDMVKITEQSEEFEKNKCIKIRGSSKYYYAKTVTNQMVKEDNKTKWLISMNLDDKTKRNIDFKNNTAYEIWNLLKKSFMKNNEEMKLDLNKKLKEMKYNINDDFGMFLSNMENTLNKLEELGEN